MHTGKQREKETTENRQKIETREGKGKMNVLKK
jgi:hypothetical protein